MNDDELKAWDDYIRGWNELTRSSRLIADLDLSHVDIRRSESKPFLTAADIVMLREMKIGLVPKY